MPMSKKIVERSVGWGGECLFLHKSRRAGHATPRSASKIKNLMRLLPDVGARAVNAMNQQITKLGADHLGHACCSPSRQLPTIVDWKLSSGLVAGIIDHFRLLQNSGKSVIFGVCCLLLNTEL